MKPISIINDLHIGVKRSAGTTPASAAALRSYLLDTFRQLMDTQDDVVILGDLFDDFTVDASDFWTTFEILAEYLKGTGDLTLVRGNHDWSPRADRKSSFDLLADILKHMRPTQVKVVREGLEHLQDDILIIPHMPNQYLFDLELDKAYERGGRYLLTHCNMMPPACYGKQDHSLSINEERAKQLAEKFVILNAHEHQHVFYNIGKGIHCLGNQVPSSIADCLSKGRAQTEGVKFMTTITEDYGLSQVTAWRTADNFKIVDWRNLADLSEGLSFIRVEGTASLAEAAQVVNAIANLRQNHDAFVISNAVQIEGQEAISEDTAEAFESVKTFDVLEAILSELDEVERKKIKEILEC